MMFVRRGGGALGWYSLRTGGGGGQISSCGNSTVQSLLPGGTDKPVAHRRPQIGGPVVGDHLFAVYIWVSACKPWLGLPQRWWWQQRQRRKRGHLGRPRSWHSGLWLDRIPWVSVAVSLADGVPGAGDKHLVHEPVHTIRRRHWAAAGRAVRRRYPSPDEGLGQVRVGGGGGGGKYVLCEAGFGHNGGGK